MAANWDACRIGLNWGANVGWDNWRTHGIALIVRSQNPKEAKDIIFRLQRHNGDAQKNYQNCYNENPEKWWEIALDVWNKRGLTPLLLAENPGNVNVEISDKGVSVSIGSPQN